MAVVKTKETNAGDQAIQADQYAFPYHYIPQVGRRLFLSRHWAFAPSYVAALNLLVEQLRPVAQAESVVWRHIDIGCGDGALIYYLSRLFGLESGRIDGVDIDARAINWARMFNSDATLHVGDMTKLDDGYASGSLVEVLEHVPPETLPMFVAAAARLLRPGGLIVVTVPSVEKPLARKHFQHFSFETIRKTLTPTFEKIEIVGFERRDRITSLIDRLRMNRFFRLDVPMLNAWAVARLQRTYRKQSGCGRLLVIGRKAG